MSSDAKRTITGRFLKQRRRDPQDDYPIQVGVVDFDATATVLQMELDEIRNIYDEDPSSDEIGRQFVEWDGPCTVEIRDSICEFFRVDYLDELTADKLLAGRFESGIVPSQVCLETLTVQIRVQCTQAVEGHEAIGSLRVLVESTRAEVLAEVVRVDGTEMCPHMSIRRDAEEKPREDPTQVR